MTNHTPGPPWPLLMTCRQYRMARKRLINASRTCFASACHFRDLGNMSRAWGYIEEAAGYLATVQRMEREKATAIAKAEGR